MSPYHHILVCVDGSPTSNKALASAVALAQGSDARLRIVYSVDELVYLTGYEASAEVGKILRDNGEKVLTDALQSAARSGVPAETQLLDVPGERLGDLIAREARSWPADLVVVGTHGRRGVGRLLLGSGAEEIIRLSPVPVLVVRGDDAR